jgi:protein-S-isoprenylcysteine O-methyltransferase Ste14
MTNELTFRVIAVLLLLSMKVIRSRTQKRSDRIGEREAFETFRLDTVLLFSLGAFWSMSVVLYGLVPQWVAWAKLHLPIWMRSIGVAFGIGSLILLAWSDHHLGANFSPTLRIRDEHTLVQSGPYRCIRHPIYLSGVMFLIAMLLVTSNWFVGLCWAGVLVVYAHRIPIEENLMLEKFGDSYREYMNRTGRLLPKLGRRRSPSH